MYFSKNINVYMQFGKRKNMNSTAAPGLKRVNSSK